MPLDPNQIVWIARDGNGNMGSVSDATSLARFHLKDARRWILAEIRGTFTGGAGTADLAIKVDRGSQLSGLYNATLFTVTGVGSSKPLHFRVQDDEIDRWVFEGGDQHDEIVLEWTNPDPGDMYWAVEVGLIDAANRS